jgi:hypothetical protein
MHKFPEPMGSYFLDLIDCLLVPDRLNPVERIMLTILNVACRVGVLTDLSRERLDQLQHQSSGDLLDPRNLTSPSE